MHAAHIEEPDNTYVIANLTLPEFSAALPEKGSKDSEVRRSQTMLEYASVGARHLQQLADMADLSDDALRIHAFEIAQATGESLQETLQNLRKMLLNHAQEWRDFMAAQGEQSFIASWMERGHYGRPE
jgi:hypothetical protein